MTYEDVTEVTHKRIRELTYELIRISAPLILQNDGKVELAGGRIFATGRKEHPDVYDAGISICLNGLSVEVEWLFGNAFVMSTREAREQIHLVYLVDGRHNETMAIEGSVKEIISTLSWAIEEFKSTIDTQEVPPTTQE